MVMKQKLVAPSPTLSRKAVISENKSGHALTASQERTTKSFENAMRHKYSALGDRLDLDRNTGIGQSVFKNRNVQLQYEGWLMHLEFMRAVPTHKFGSSK